MTPKISVIVPVYNNQDFLRQCIDSVLAQSCYDWELILVDDGSTDSSLSICRNASLLDKRIKTVTIPHSGVSTARNKGIDLSCGEFIAFIDADDVMHPSLLSILLKECILHDADISASTISRFLNLESLSGSHSWLASQKKDNSKIPSTIYTGEEMAVRMLYQKGANSSACGKLFRSSLFASFRFREGIRYEDLDLIPKVAAEAKTAIQIQLPLYYYRNNPESFTHTFSLRRADALKATAALSEYFSTRSPKLAKAAADRELSACFNIFCLIASHKDFLSHSEKEEADRISDRCWKKIKELRMQSFLNSKVRIKNKLGILVSWLGGRKSVALLARF